MFRGIAVAVVALGGVLALGLSGVARADVVNFDEFTSPPVTCCFGDFTGPFVYPHVTITDGAGSGSIMDSTGWNNEQTSGNNLYGTESGQIDFLFNTPASNLVFDLINGSLSAGPFTVNLYNGSNTLIDSQTFDLTAYTHAGSIEHVSFGDSGILKTVILGGNDFAVDTISFDVSGGPAVPEPATWALMLLGIGGIGAALRMGRRTTAALVAA
jgi:hypothetical protein